jgi:hypothetical protein
MVLPNSRMELDAAWRALRSEASGVGWKTIRILSRNVCPVFAGREMPGNHESMLVGFKGIAAPAPDTLPQSAGFTVACPDIGEVGAGFIWIGLTRQPDGPLDLFAAMADDVLGVTDLPNAGDDHQRYKLFIDRIVAWQEFMRRGASPVLTAEEEAGLVGELEILKLLLKTSLSPASSVNAWQGPTKALHDFTLRSGAIEVKTTTAVTGFPAKISSLDQLDDAIASPLFIAAVRIPLVVDGNTLPEKVDAIRKILEPFPIALSDFDSRLVGVGYLDIVRERYARRFGPPTITVMRVDAGFPRLTPSVVPAAIKKARYEMDLSMVNHSNVELAAAFSELGVE